MTDNARPSLTVSSSRPRWRSRHFSLSKAAVPSQHEWFSPRRSTHISLVVAHKVIRSAFSLSCSYNRDLPPTLPRFQLLRGRFLGIRNHCYRQRPRHRWKYPAIVAMAAAFRPVNSPLATTMSREDVMASSPATPRPNTAPQPDPPRSFEDSATPTRATFAGSMANQKPLPSSPFPQGVQVPGSAPIPRLPQRGNSRHSNKSADSGDIDMDDSDGETGTAEDGVGSDDESIGADGPRSSKKKKSQRFYCTDFPPCNLSFTRSEHLARHIRYVGVCSCACAFVHDAYMSCLGNTQANGLFSATVLVASQGLTI